MKHLLLAFFVFSAPALAQSQCSPVLLDSLASARPLCDNTTNDPLFWNETFWNDPVNNQPDMPEAAVDLSLRVLDTCHTGPITVKYVLRLDLDGNGSRETTVDSDSLHGWGRVWFNNTNGAGTARQFDKRAVLANQKYGFALQTTLAGGVLTAAVRWNTQSEQGSYVLPELPTFAKNVQHQIEWRVTHNGQTTAHAQFFSLTDCAVPQVTCINGLSVNFMPTKTITLSKNDFLLNTKDNITPTNQLVVAIRKAGAGTGFPLNADSTAQGTVTWGCPDIGTRMVEVWSRDKYGNADFCVTFVAIQDNLFNCNPPPYVPPLVVKAICSLLPMAGVKIGYYNLNGVGPVGPVPLGETYGDGSFNLPPILTIDSFSVHASRNSDPLNGVSTHDLIAINKHILGLVPFDQPWKFVAADANNNRSVTTFDITEIRKLILGVYTSFPANTAWRFVPDTYVFPSPNPLSVPLPTQVDIGLTPIGFFGIKIGDLNCNATVQAQSGPQDRAPAALALPDVFLASGQTVETPLYAPDGAEWAGFQFALQYDPEKIELETAVPGDLAGLDEEAFARPVPGMLTASWFGTTSRQIEAGTPFFHLRWRAKRPVRLSDAVRFAPTMLRPEVYEADGQERNLALVFGARPGEQAGSPTIFSPLPNPTGAGANIPVQLASDTEVHLELFDAGGRLVFQHLADAGAGMYWCAIPASAMPHPGVFVWRVRAGAAVETGRLVRH